MKISFQLNPINYRVKLIFYDMKISLYQINSTLFTKIKNTLVVNKIHTLINLMIN